MTECSPCGLLFSGTSAFDRHRVGSHWPVCERRCLDNEEMTTAGIELDSRGHWTITQSEGQKAQWAAVREAERADSSSTEAQRRPPGLQADR